MRRVVWHTTLLGLVSLRQTHAALSLTHSQARLLSYFGKPCSDPVTRWFALVNSCTCSAHWRFLYFHGQRHARLMRNQTVYDKPKRERSLLITFLSPLLFLAPEVHLREMEKLWTDEIIIETVWKSSMSKLLAEWEGVILWVRIQSQHNWLSVSRCYLVDSDVSGQRRLSCNPWRSHFKY